MRMARPKSLWLELAAVAARVRSARSLAVASDFDGTLTPIVSHPDRAVLSARARSALVRIGALPGARLAVLSGRTLDDLDRQLGIPGVFLAGITGAETRDPTGRRQLHVPPGEEIPAELRRGLEEWCARFPGAWVEDKGVSIALHYRAIPESRHAVFGTGIRRRVSSYPGRVALIHGKRVFEVLPAGAPDKASALERWLADAPDPPLVFFFGDDSNDEPAHEWVRSRSGVSVAVGRPATRAGYAVATPDDVVWFLEWLDREWREREGSGSETAAAVAAHGAGG
jgi:trehalose 6-phosphate phosphatase